VDSGVLLFALALTIVMGLLFGIAPALHAAKADLSEVLMQAIRKRSPTSCRSRPALTPVPP
jgi:hypothetical protein